MTDDGDERPIASTDRPGQTNTAGTPSASSNTAETITERAATPAIADETVAPPMVAAYRHDLHKLRLRSHADAVAEHGDVAVNETVPLGADRDAALLSRPRGDPAQTVDNHASPYRLSLLTGEPAPLFDDKREERLIQTVAQVTTITDAKQLHAVWLLGRGPALLNESLYYPYTSLKYHTLLVAALLDNYRAGHSFGDLTLAVAPPRSEGIDGSVHRTICTTPWFSLRLTATPGDRPATPLGAAPAQSWADVWSRVPTQPLPTDDNRGMRILDAQLRRIQSWSVALQYLEDYRRQATSLQTGGPN